MSNKLESFLKRTKQNDLDRQAKDLSQIEEERSRMREKRLRLADELVEAARDPKVRLVAEMAEGLDVYHEDNRYLLVTHRSVLQITGDGGVEVVTGPVREKPWRGYEWDPTKTPSEKLIDSDWDSYSDLRVMKQMISRAADKGVDMESINEAVNNTVRKLVMDELIRSGNHLGAIKLALGADVDEVI